MNKKTLLYSILAANLGIITFFWAQTNLQSLFESGSSLLLALGRLTGLLAVFFVLLQFIMMGRLTWVESVFGLDKLSQIHRLNGYLSLTFIILHPMLITLSYAQFSGVSYFAQSQEFLSSYEDIPSAVFSQFLFIVVVVSSVYIVFKRLKYEFWYVIHFLTYLAVFLAYGHQLVLGGDFGNDLFTYYWQGLYVFVIANVVYFRFIRSFLLNVKHQFVIQKIVKEGISAHSVYITGKNLDQFTSTPGQFMKIRFLNKNFWQEHPFSLSFIPKDNHLRLTIKNSGDFTSTIGGIKPGTRAYLDGPFGSFKLNTNANKFLFIAGGVGITPIRSLIEQAGSLKKDIVLLYSNSYANDIILKDEIDALSKQYKFPVHYIITQDTKWKGEKGRIDTEKLKRLVPDLKKRDIYLCGPTPFMTGIKKILLDLGVTKSAIHFEKFSLH